MLQKKFKCLKQLRMKDFNCIPRIQCIYNARLLFCMSDSHDFLDMAMFTQKRQS